MKRIAVICLVAAAALTTAAAGESKAKGDLCVGGPHCYAAIQDALNAAGDGDTISIGPGTFAGGITITHSVTLQGVAAAASKISGGGPVVTIGSKTSAPTVTLRDLTVTGGLATSNPHAPSCGPDVPRCGPGYADATALGGGIEAFQGTTVTIERSAVTGNRATPELQTQSVKAVCPGGPCPASFGDAAGIDNWGTMTLIDSTVSDNHASAAQSNGGGIAVEGDASLTVIRSSITGNSAEAAPPFGRFVSGGGIFVDGGATLTVDSSSIDDNQVNLTSSIPHPYPLQDGGNDQSNAFSAGIQLSDGSTAAISHSSISDNSITVSNAVGEPFGADVAFCECGVVDLTIADTRIERNSLTVNVLSSADAGPSGPTAFEIDGPASISETRIAHNSAVVTTPNGDAGALGTVFLINDGSFTPTITNSEISDNTSTANAPNGAATVQGGGLVVNAPVTITGTTVRGNRAVANGATGFAQGGGIWNGALFEPAGSALALLESSVTNNSVSGSPGVDLSGGGLYTVGFPPTLTNTVVAHNAPDQCDGC